MLAVVHYHPLIHALNASHKDDHPWTLALSLLDFSISAKWKFSINPDFSGIRPFRGNSSRELLKNAWFLRRLLMRMVPLCEASRRTGYVLLPGGIVTCTFLRNEAIQPGKRSHPAWKRSLYVVQANVISSRGSGGPVRHFCFLGPPPGPNMLEKSGQSETVSPSTGDGPSSAPNPPLREHNNCKIAFREQSNICETNSISGTSRTFRDHL